MDLLSDPLITRPIQTGWEFTIEPYLSWQFGLIDNADCEFGNGSGWTRHRTRSDGPEPLVTLPDPNTAYTDYSIQGVPHTPSIAFTEYSIQWVLHTRHAASSQDWQSPTPTQSLISQQTIMYSIPHICTITTWPVNRALAPIAPPSWSTASRLSASQYTSNLAPSWPPGASPNLLNHSLQMYL